jgi:NAD(P)-dependent dehydrogenase (short-subunit alcohol dehydrogenase family)
LIDQIDFRNGLAQEGRSFMLLGAGQGIGIQIARALTQVGAQVLCVDRDAAGAQATADEVGAYHCAADVTRREDMVPAFRLAHERFGEIHGVINIVGQATIRSILDYTDEEWNSQFDIVVKHALLTLQVGMKYLRAGSSFTFIGSLAGDRAVVGQPAYGSAKAALHHLVRGAAVEFGPKGVRVNAVAPGFIFNPRLRTLLGPDQWKKLEAHIPLRGAAHPSEIAGAVLFLVSTLASHVTGVILPVDGGLGPLAGLPTLDWRPQ